MAHFSGKVLALAGGVGGAKLALGLSRILSPDQLTIVVNTGDDETFHGLHVSPDLDTMLYTLAGLSNPETGWGLAGESFRVLEMLNRYGADTWFNLGDMDMATHIRRTQLLREGATLSEVTAELCLKLGVQHRIIPMSDDSVRTFIGTDQGELAMQDYFVRLRCEPTVASVSYMGAEDARPSEGFSHALEEADLVALCPSNPLLSTGPILVLPTVREELARKRSGRLRVAVSPIIGGAAVRGPAARIMTDLGHDATSLGVAKMYQDICDTFVIDEQDAKEAPAIAGLGVKPVTAPTIMNTEEDKVALARIILELGGGFQHDE
ncbi:MAG: 2-phospho-L-lactate transferase [Chloroflexi bacterium]|nr:2-phospho-L-lactate transferase [Chloroflexota bacterium]